MVEVDASSVTDPPAGTVRVGASSVSATLIEKDFEYVFPNSSVETILIL